MPFTPDGAHYTKHRMDGTKWISEGRKNEYKVAYTLTDRDRKINFTGSHSASALKQNTVLHIGITSGSGTS